MYRSVIFDLDGTLLYTIEDLADAGNEAMKQLGLPTHSCREFRQLVGHGKINLLKDLLTADHLELLPRASAIFDDYYQHNMMHKTTAYPGIAEMLKRFKQAGIGLGVLSNKPDMFAPAMIEHYFPGLFTVVWGAKAGQKIKPDPDSLLKIAAELKQPLDATLYVGDSEVDVLTGRNAGIATAGVTWGYRSRQTIIDEKPDYLIDRVDQLTALVLTKDKIC